MRFRAGRGRGLFPAADRSRLHVSAWGDVVMTVMVYAIGRPEVPPFPMSDRFRHEVTYFMEVPPEGGQAGSAAGEYRIDAERAKTWYDDGVFSLVSPLDSQNQTEVELTEEQEGWLEWLIANGVSHIRLA